MPPSPVRRQLAVLAAGLLLPLLAPLPATAGEPSELWLDPAGAVTSGPLRMAAGVYPTGTSTPPTGDVALTLAGERLGTITLSPNGAGMGEFTSPAEPGEYQVAGHYSGDAVYDSAMASTSVVVRDSTTTSLVAVTSGRDVTLRATVLDDQQKCPGVLGEVTFFDGRTKLGAASLVSGSSTSRSDASFTAKGLSGGTHTFRAQYFGGSCLHGSEGTATATVTLSSTTTRVTATPSAAALGQQVTLSAEVTAVDGTSPTGTVRFSAGTFSGTATLSGGRAMLSTRELPSGTHEVHATYSGSSSLAPSAATTTLAVQPPLFGAATATPIGSWPTSVAIGDFTGDGRDDTLTSTGYDFDPVNDYKLFLSVQQADGTLGVPVRLTTDGGYGDALRLATGHLDGDGRLDAVLAVKAGVDVFTAGATPLGKRVLVATPSAARDVTVADLNGDGRRDLVVATASHGVLSYAQDKRGRFPSAKTVSSTTVGLLEVADLDGDGRPDVAGTSGSSVVVVRQTGTGAWAAPVMSAAAGPVSGIDTGDVTGDGRADVVATSGGNRPASVVQVFAQAVGGLAAPRTYASYDIPEPAVVADVDGDGRKDVVVAHGGWNRIGVYRQSPDGTLADEALYAVPYASHYDPRGLAVGDLDGNGRPDLALADYNSGLVVLRHT